MPDVAAGLDSFLPLSSHGLVAAASLPHPLSPLPLHLPTGYPGYHLVGVVPGDAAYRLGLATTACPSCSPIPRRLYSQGLGTTLGLLRTWVRVM